MEAVFNFLQLSPELQHTFYADYMDVVRFPPPNSEFSFVNF